MAPNDAGGVAKQAAGAERGREPAAADARRPGPMTMLRLYAFQLMLHGATPIDGGYHAPSWQVGRVVVCAAVPRLFPALVVWLVGCLSFFMARPWR
ncbi:hypothetical protein ABZP36_022222 [Zizania latifolia]